MAKKKDSVETKIEKVEKEVETKKSNIDTINNVTKDLKGKLTTILDKNVGKLSVKQILLCVLAIVVFIIVVVGISKSFSADAKVPDYSVVYVNEDSKLMVATSNGKKTYKLAADADSDEIVYANTTDRYILFTKDSALYLFDSHKGEETTKIANDVVYYGFSDDDKYIYYVNEDDELFSYVKEGNKLDTDVDSILSVTKNKIVYSKDDTVYVRSLNYKKDEKIKVVESPEEYLVNEDASKIVYLTGDDELYLFKNKKATKIAGDVDSLSSYSEDLNKLIYISDDSVYTAKGTKTTKLAGDVDNILYANADTDVIVYEKEDEFFYQKGTKAASKITDESISEVYMYDNDLYYTIYDDSEYELFMATISGNKVKSTKSVAEDVSSRIITNYEKGLLIFTDVDKNVGTLSKVTNGKTKKIANDVSVYYATISNDGKTVYYLQDYSNYSGNLMKSTGGKGKSIASDVSNYVYVKNDLIYLMTGYSVSSGKGDLYVSNGKKSKLIEYGVQEFTSSYVKPHVKK